VGKDVRPPSEQIPGGRIEVVVVARPMDEAEEVPLTPRPALPRVSSDPEWALPAPWRVQHCGEDRTGHRAHPAGRDEARLVLRRGEGRKAVLPATDETVEG
jgi:hypothetical protein